MKKYSEKAAAAVLNSVLKYTRNNDCREALWYAWQDVDGRQCVIDGFRAFRLAVPVEGVPQMPEGMTPVDLPRVYEGAERGALREIPAPTPAELAALAAYDRAHGGALRYMYMFGEGLPVVNLAYLRDALKVFPDARLFVRDVISPVILKSTHGDGLILPIRIDDRFRKRREVVYSLSTFAQRYAA